MNESYLSSSQSFLLLVVAVTSFSLLVKDDPILHTRGNEAMESKVAGSQPEKHAANSPIGPASSNLVQDEERLGSDLAVNWLSADGLSRAGGDASEQWQPLKLVRKDLWLSSQEGDFFRTAGSDLVSSRLNEQADSVRTALSQILAEETRLQVISFFDGQDEAKLFEMNASISGNRLAYLRALEVIKVFEESRINIAEMSGVGVLYRKNTMGMNALCVNARQCVLVRIESRAP